MRLTTFRALLLVLAMVLQTVAGGATLARAASTASGETISAQCHFLRADEHPASNDKAGHRHNCHTCLLCAEPPPAWVSLASDYTVALGEHTLIDARPYAPPSFSERSSRAHSARAPPVSRA